MNISKKLLSVFLAFAILLIALPISKIESFATDPSDFSYYVISEDDKTAEITGYSGSGGDVEIPSIIDEYTIVSIGDYAFESADSITSFIIPETISSISSMSFFGCYSCESFIVSTLNSHYSSCDGVLFDKNIESLIAYPCGKTDSFYSVPSTVQTIGEYAFVVSLYLTEVYLPDSVTSVGDFAFVMSQSLQRVSGGVNLDSLGEGAFSTCEMLNSISLSDGISYIGGSCFGACSSLERISIPSGMSIIYEYTFYSIPASEIAIPDGVTQIKNSAFVGCNNLSSVIIPSSVTAIAYDAFDSSYLTTIYGFSGSYAETFANDNGYTFIDLDTLTTYDMNNDGTANGTDLDTMLNIAAGITEPTAIQLYLGDYNSDRVIDGFDVAYFDRVLNANS